MPYKRGQATPKDLPNFARYVFRELERLAQEFYITSPQEWVDVTFENSWVNFGGGFNDCQYRKVGNDVEIRGMVKDGTIPATIFTIPENFRPVNAYFFDAISGGSQGRIRIGDDGAVTIAAGSAAYISLDGIRFSLN